MGGISVDHTFNLLAVQSTSSSAKVYRIIKQKKKNKKYRTVQHVSLTYYPHSMKELEQQQIYNQQYKEEKKELEKIENDNNNDPNKNTIKQIKPKKVTTILLSESSHATCVRFNPLKLKLNDIDKGSIVDKYNIKYRMLFAIICGSELFVFDTSKNNAIFYWKDEDTQNFFDMEWNFDGTALLISDVEGFITRLNISKDDIIPI